MKRSGNLFDKITEMDNIRLADAIARKGKLKQPGVIAHDLRQEENLAEIQSMLLNNTYCTSPYTVFKIYEPKEREIYRLPYYPDRIVHHAIMNVLEPVFVAMFTTDTYSCLKGRGIHGAANAVKKAFRDKDGTQYFLKMDIRKFYPSVDHTILKLLLRRKFKDARLLALLDEIIDSAPGLPIGNYLSQYLSNFYLTGFDHWLKEVKGVRYYFRYADDMVILSHSKDQLHDLRRDIADYLAQHLNLQLKPNWRVAPVVAQGLDFVGYVFYHTHTLARKTIKQNFARAVARGRPPESLASYMGWMAHCNSKNLINKILPSDKFQRLRHHTRPDLHDGR